MIELTEKQKIASSRNWNKRMLLGAAYSLRAIVSSKKLSIGILESEKKIIANIYNQIFTLISNWRKRI